MTLDEKDKRPEETGTDTAEMGSATLGGYVNPYEGQIMELYKGISERKPFRYDVNEDVMYQNLRDQYIAGGQMAMMDTMGQAAQLTGGYGNSYAQGVGQQAYQGYLQGLNDQIPDLYNMALQNYIQTGDAMLQQYGMLQDMAADDYGKYQDQMALVQPQVLEMLESGIRPSDEMIAASGLSKEYIDAMYPEKTPGSGTYKPVLSADDIYAAASEYGALEPAIAEIRAAKESGLMSQDEFEYYMTKAHQELPSAHAQGIGPGETIRAGKKK